MPMSMMGLTFSSRFQVTQRVLVRNSNNYKTHQMEEISPDLSHHSGKHGPQQFLNIGRPATVLRVCLEVIDVLTEIEWKRNRTLTIDSTDIPASITYFCGYKILLLYWNAL